MPSVDTSTLIRRGFASTHWTTIQACKGQGQAALVARSELCRRYWYPVYAFFKRSGLQGYDAEDLTQDFFADILQRDWFEQADQTRGRFRSFLLASIKNFLKVQAARKGTIKRGGEYQHVPIDIAGARVRYSQSSAGQSDPLETYDLEWANAITSKTIELLQSEYTEAGKLSQFKLLERFLISEGDANTYGVIAAALNTTASNIQVAVHRLRKRYGAIMREQVGMTVAAPQDVEDEMRHIRKVLIAAK